MTARIDVLIPAYNAAATLRESLASIQRQTLADIRIHVVDDGSSDATPAVLAEMASADARIHVHRKANGGIVNALNHGLKHCTAEFIARFDADDISYPDRLAVQLAYLDGHPDSVAVGAAVRHIDAQGVPTGTEARLAQPDAADPWLVPSREPYIIHPFLLARRAALQAIGGYRQVHYAEDTDLYWRLLDIGRLHNLPDLLGDYRLHNGSISGNSIVNGRIMSVSSQLAAISARRRRQGVADLEFTHESLAGWRAVGSLALMVALASASLDDGERRWFEEAVAAKLLELASYRPYELEPEDCVFVGVTARRGFDHLQPDNRSLQIRRITGTAARLAAAGRIRDARAMLPPALYPGWAARTLARVAIPDRVRKSLRKGGAQSLSK